MVNTSDPRPASDLEIAALRRELARPNSERGIRDIMNAEEWIPQLMARIESDREIIGRLKDQNDFLRHGMTAHQALMLDKVPCTCKPGDGSTVCPHEDECRTEWCAKGTAVHTQLDSPDSTE